MSLNQLVKAVAPNVDVSKLKVTRDSPMWYRELNGILYVPAFEVLKRNVLELGKFVEVLKVFSLEGKETRNNWDNLELSHICTAAQIRELHETLRTHKICAVDIETKNLGWDDNQLLAIGFAYDENKAVAIEWEKVLEFDRANGYIPDTLGYGKRTGKDYVRDSDEDSALYVLQVLLEDPEITFIWHNGKFDCSRLKFMLDIDARVDEDTMLQHYAQISEKRGTHGLKDLGPLYLQAPQWDDELTQIRKEYCRKNKILLADFTFDLLPMDVLIPYMQRDCIATFRLHHLFNVLKNEGTDWVYRKLVEASPIYGAMELKGMLIDKERMVEVDQYLTSELQLAEQKFGRAVAQEWDPKVYVIETGAKTLPKEFNLKSPKQLKWLLEKIVGHRLKSTDASTIESLKSDRPEHAEILEALRKIRLYSKQLDTYVAGLSEKVNADGRVRTTFNLHGTETGRLSSSKPNLQNIPRTGPIKSVFVAPEGKQLLQLDYSQAELRVLAYLSKDEFMTQLYKDNRDIHSEIATAVYGQDFTSENRSNCKTVVFGTIYGQGASGVAGTINDNAAKDAPQMSVHEATKLINNVFKYMPQASKWIQDRRQAATRGDDCVSVFGRRRHLVMLDRSTLNHIQNEYINTPVQSAASDITLFALMEMDHQLRKSGLDATLVCTVHDSIMLEVADQDVDATARMCIDIMETLPKKLLPDLEVPFKADAEFGKSWGSLQKWEGKT